MACSATLQKSGNPREGATASSSFADNFDLITVMHTVLDGLIIVDGDGLIQMFNPAAERIFGFTPDEVMGKSVKMLMPEPYHGRHDGYMHRYMETGEAKVIGIGREVLGRRKDGDIFPMDLGINEMQMRGKRMFVGTIRDISKRKESEEKIKQYVAALQRSNQELDSFAYVCSHDLQEPLRMILNFTERLEHHLGASLDPKAQHYMRYVTGSAARARDLIRDMLSLARIDQQSEAEQNVATEEVLTEVLLDLAALIEEHEAQISSEPLPEIHVQPTHMRQLLQNLIANALKFCTAKPCIHIAAVKDGSRWQFSVRDNGIGIAPEHLPKLFQIFQRLHHREDYPGTGIGLAVCKKIVQKYGGAIWVESLPNKGSTFFFTLPVASITSLSEAA
jgi:PAS domain S-box-containing protein